MVCVSPEKLAKEVERLLEVNPQVYMPTKGDSMRPFIIGEDDLVAVRKPPKEYRKGFVVLARTLDRRVVMHRVVAIGKEYLDLMGDANLYGRERCRRSDVVAIADYIIKKDGRKRYINSERQLRMWRFWYWLRPVRKWLLRLV